MLTKEILKADKTLAELTDAQIAVIETLSRNDEERVIDKKVGEKTGTLLTRIDEIIEGVVGEKKPDNTKTHDYLETTLKVLKKASSVDAKALQSQIDGLKADKADLEKKIRDGATDGELKKQVGDLQQQIKDKTDELATFKTQQEAEIKKITDELAAEKGKVLNLEFDASVNAHLVSEGVRFKDTIPETTRIELMDIRKAKLLSRLKTDYIDDGKGGKRQVFRDDKGEIMRNPDNKLEPFTAAELYMKEISDLVDLGKKQTGTGGGSPNGGGGGSGNKLDLSGITNQVKADEMIKNFIIREEGIATTDPRHGERHAELRTELKVADLPVKEPVNQ